MITAIELENFKGFGARQRIELGPLTLLFGANSAGKSSVLQALGYVYELLVHGDPNVDQTEIGGATAPLGGFGRLIHNHKSDDTMRIRVEFDVPGTLNVRDIDLEGFPFPEMDDDVSKGWIEYEIKCHQPLKSVEAATVAVSFGVENDHRPMLVLRQKTIVHGGPILAAVLLTHDCLRNGSTDLMDDWRQVANRAEMDFTFGLVHPDSMPVFAINGHFAGSAVIPVGYGAVRLITDDSEKQARLDFGETAVASATIRNVEQLIELVAGGLSHRLFTLLSEVLHIGPLRSIPTRGYLFEHHSRTGSWGDGLAAWDALLADRGIVIEGTNEWLKRLGSRSRIDIISYMNHDVESDARAAGSIEAGFRRLVLRTDNGSSVLPSEVGAGISQVVPVIVAAVRCLSPRREQRPTMLFVEQPELHLHPAMQTGLGDLLRQASSNSQVIVETHSEHLILRLLRRIRDTADGEARDEEQLAPDQLTVLHISNDDGHCIVRRFRVDRNGDFDEPWPNGFFAERAAEVF